MGGSKDGLFKRGRVYYAWVRGERVSCRTSDRKAAQIYKARLERASADPAYLAANETTFADAVKSFEANFMTRDRSPHTLKRHNAKARHLARVIGAGARLADVVAATVDAFVEKRLEEGASRGTLASELTTLRGILKLAKRHGTYPFDLEAVMPLAFSNEYKPRERALEWPELEKLLAEVARFSLLHARMLAFIVATGARKSEAEAARAEDVDWTRGTVLIRGGKTKASWAAVPILAPFAGLLAMSGPHAFGTWTNMTRDLAAACKRAKIPKATANDFRRTTATLLRRAGVATDMIARMLRHTDSRMVERVYGRVGAEDAGRVMTVQMQRSDGVFASPDAASQLNSGSPLSDSDRRPAHYEGDSTQFAGGPKLETTALGRSDASDRSGNSSHRPYSNSTALAVLDRLAAVGFRSLAAAWFKRAA